jgi:hypothetical protein
MSNSPKWADCGHSLESHTQNPLTSKIYKCSECICEIKGDPHLRKTSFRRTHSNAQTICSMCLREKPIIYYHPDEYQRDVGICQECYDKLPD